MKKAGVMQPYFFPYVGYISLIKHTEEFILLDTVQFIRHGWIERNRILKQDEGWTYIKVPLLKHSRETTIKDVVIDNSQDWKTRIYSQLEVYKKSAPQYQAVIKLIQDVFAHEYSTISSLNSAALKAVCSYLGITTKISVFSQSGLHIKPPVAPDEWALNICEALGNVSEYWNLSGGQAFFDKSKYDAAGMGLIFQENNLKEYDQRRLSFEPGLSIIDVMMFNSVEEVNKILDS